MTSLIFAIQISAMAFSSPLFGEYIEAVKSSMPKTENPSPKTDSLPIIPRWSVIESNSFMLYYRPEANLNRIERQLRRRIAYFERSLVGEDAGITDKIAYRLDALLKRAEAILDMHPKMPKIKIKVFSGREALSEEYFRIFNEKQDFRSFYVHKYDTIYTSEEDISDSILAHEMGHAIVDNYFEIIPPAKVAEVLASYVDMHLDD